MQEIEAYFGHYGSRKISEYAHNEMGWIETEENQPISYKYAEELRELISRLSFFGHKNRPNRRSLSQ
jgi:uncharacterized protein (DUF924 family)